MKGSHQIEFHNQLSKHYRTLFWHCLHLQALWHLRVLGHSLHLLLVI